ncbi:MAG: CbtA family protein [Alphaproteobacteria bacterium]|nr:CbtA family protein [Alphaproteobacteria bacterium]
MIRRLFLAAIAAGVLAGVIISAIHQVTTVPIILQAETYEDAATKASVDDPGRVLSAGFRFLNPAFISKPPYHPVHGGKADDGQGAWAPEDGMERVLFTVTTTVLSGVGFALLLVVGMMLRGETLDARRGVIWGAAGFVAFTLAPTLGLPPEIPGAATADLMARQVWWISAAVAAMAGLWLLVFTEGLAWKVVGVVLMAAPNIYGAPHPHAFSTGGVPAELAAQFAATSIGISALFWALLGGLSGYFLGRLSATE